MKSKIKKILIAALLQILFAATLFAQKYENGTKLLKGAEVLSATPLQLDYVLETLADTAKITVNLHEGKTHLVLNDGSGQWREWWYHEGRWKLKTQESQGASPEGLEGSIQTKSGNRFAGSTLGINNGLIGSLSSSDAGFTGNNTFFSFSPQGVVEHRQNNNLWNFRSMLSDTTFYVKNRITFDQPNTGDQVSISTKNHARMNLMSKVDNTLSRISISSGSAGQKGVDLYSKNTNTASRLLVSDSNGVEISGQSYTGVTNEMKHNYLESKFIYTDGAINREFVLNNTMMYFALNEGSVTKTRLTVGQSRLTYYTDDAHFSVDDKGLIYRSKITGKTGEYLYYNPVNELLRIRNAVGFITEDGYDMPTISLTSDKDIKFTRNALPYKTITLTEIMQKGQIIKQSTEPDIPDNSFAFWVNGSTFYLILRSGGVQKKIQFE